MRDALAGLLVRFAAWSDAPYPVARVLVWASSWVASPYRAAR